MKKSFAVLGLGRFGRVVAEEMMASGADVLAVDRDEEKVRRLADIVTVAVQADVCNDEAMAKLGLKNMDGAVIAMSESVESSIMAIMTAKKAGIPAVWVKAMNETQKEIFLRIGADRVFIPEKEQGINVARSMLSGSFLDFVGLSERISMIKLPVRPEWVGRTLSELELRRNLKINVIAISRNGQVSQDIDPQEQLSADSVLFVIADRNGVENLLNPRG